MSNEVRILMVDDRPENLLALEAILSGNGYTIERAANADEALLQVLKHEFAVILLDVMMPEIDGYELARLIRQREATRHVPIIFLTAVATDPAHVLRGYALGAADYLLKPLEPAVVRAKVAVFVELFVISRRLLAQESLLRENEGRQREFELTLIRREGERRLADLVQTIPGVVWEADFVGGELVPRFFSAYLERLSGYAPSDFLGRHYRFAARMDAGDRMRLAQLLDQVARIGGQGTFEFDLTARNGRVLRVESHYKAVQGRDGRVLGLRGVALDMTERQRVTEELKRAKDSAESANRLKSVFLANMSHEIRTPLGAVLGFSELIRDTALTTEERERYGEIITRNGQSLSRLIDDILDFSKVESNQMSIELLELDLGGIAADVFSSLRIKAQAKGITLELVDGVRPGRAGIVSDPVRVRQILTNLIDNAIKFTAEGQVRVELSIEAGQAFVRVVDTGIGLSEIQQARIFRPFHQADPSTTRKFGGTGLGLVLSQRLARLLGGDVRLERSALGKGSTFTFTIRDLTDQRPRLQPKKTEDEIDLSDLGGLKVLLVEDSADNREFIKHVLEKMGVVVTTAEDGAEALDLAIASEYDLVLMDIQMPVLDGYEATRRLRAQAFKKPVIGLSAHAHAEHRAEGLAAGCTDFVTKPATRLELSRALAKAMRAERTRQQTKDAPESDPLR